MSKIIYLPIVFPGNIIPSKYLLGIKKLVIIILKLLLILKSIIGIIRSNSDNGINIFILSDKEVDENLNFANNKKQFPIYMGDEEI